MKLISVTGTAIAAFSKMAKIPVGCRVDEMVAQKLDDLAQSRGLDRAGVIRAAIARELGQDTGEDLTQVVARLEARVNQLENILLSFGGAIARL